MDDSQDTMYYEETCDPPVVVSETIDTLLEGWEIFTQENQNSSSISLSLIDYLTFIKDEINLETIIETLNLCYCCDRHQKNKPFKLEKYIETPFKNNKSHINYSCNCKCRQITRFICRSEYGYCYECE